MRGLKTTDQKKKKFLKKKGVPVVAQWVKDMVLPQLWCWSKLQLRFSPWPGNFHMLWVQPKKKKKEKTHPSSPNPDQPLRIAKMLAAANPVPWHRAGLGSWQFY